MEPQLFEKLLTVTPSCGWRAWRKYKMVVHVGHVGQSIHPKTCPLANSTTYKNHIIARRRFSLIETAESCKQLYTVITAK